jgi:membrane associated rhomboid family serine protease
MYGAARMIPLRDTVPSSRPPLVNYALIAINVGVYFYELSLGPRVEVLLRTWGLVPAEFDLVDLATSMFLHGSLMHLIGNMLYLHIFGDNIEDRLGHGRYLVFYFLTGAAAGSLQALLNPTSHLPMVGASGAIAGVSGAYMLFYPTARVVTLVPAFVILYTVEIPALVFLLIWFGWQFLSGVATMGGDDGGGIAFWAHVGGFVAGVVLGPAFSQLGRARGRRWA